LTRSEPPRSCAKKLPGNFKDKTVKTEHSGAFQIVYLGYWETYDARQWGIIEGITDKSLRVRSDVNMPIGAKLRIRIFRILGHDFDKFQALVEIAEKHPCWDGGLEAYEYELEFMEISKEDRLKLSCSFTTQGEARKSTLFIQ
jgi:hypothetical protein